MYKKRNQHRLFIYDIFLERDLRDEFNDMLVSCPASGIRSQLIIKVSRKYQGVRICYWQLMNVQLFCHQIFFTHIYIDVHKINMHVRKINIHIRKINIHVHKIYIDVHKINIHVRNLIIVSVKQTICPQSNHLIRKIIFDIRNVFIMSEKCPEFNHHFKK